jgi:Icc-related predicted phosphoesterase
MTSIFHISDWHGRNEDFQRQLDREIRWQKLGTPDLVVITGDMIHNFAPARSRIQGIDPYEERRQLVHYEILIDAVDATWPGTDIFAVRGNHDWCNYGIDGSVKAFDVLEGQTYIWKGLKVHGFRGVPAYGPWNDGYSEVALQALCDLVPLDTDILITHCPPRGIMDDIYDAHCYTCGAPVDPKDGLCHKTHIYNPAITNPIQTVIPRNLGSDAIERLVKKLPNLKAHFFGHVHEAGGRVEVRNGKIFSNASCSLNTVVL